MIASLVRSPCNFFDSTPSGILVNKLSNDLGTIDNNLFYTLTDTLEGIIGFIVAIANITQINFIFIIPATIVLSFALCFFIYARPAYIACKQLFLQTRNLMIHFLSETINGLTQIIIYKQQVNRMQEFS